MKPKGRFLTALALVLSLFSLLLTGYQVFLRPAGNVKLMKGYRILLAGDSRSSDDYTFYKEILEKKSGATVLTDGASGCTAAYNASDEYFNRIVSDDHDFSIWLVGGNDPGSRGTVGTFSPVSPLAEAGEPVVTETDIVSDYAGDTFIQAVDHMMRKYKTLFYDPAKNASGRIQRMIFCTDLPQQRDSEESEWSLQENWERKRLAIMECCEKNGIPCLDLYALCGFDMSFEPMFHAPTDTKTNNGIYYMDGLHPNPRGIDLITSLEIRILEQYLLQNN